jgi:hypothetical protein
MKKETRTVRKKKLVLEIETIRLQDLQAGARTTTDWTSTHTQVSGCVCCTG